MVDGKSNWWHYMALGSQYQEYLNVQLHLEYAEIDPFKGSMMPTMLQRPPTYMNIRDWQALSLLFHRILVHQTKRTSEL
jgi:hypothetical protein